MFKENGFIWSVCRLSALFFLPPMAMAIARELPPLSHSTRHSILDGQLRIDQRVSGSRSPFHSFFKTMRRFVAYLNRNHAWNDSIHGRVCEWVK